MRASALCISLAAILSLPSSHEEGIAADESAPKPLVTISVKGERVASNAHWMAFTPSGSLLAIRSSDRGSHDAKIDIFKAVTGESIVSALITGGGTHHHPACAISPSGDWIAYGEGKNLRFLAIPPNNGPLPGDGKIGVFSRNRFNNSWEGDVSVWLDQKGKSAFIHRNGSGLPAVAALRGWDLRKMSGRDLVPVPELESVIYAVALSPAARQLAISVKPLSQQGKPTIECWPIADKPTMRTIKTRFRASSLAYSPDGKILAAGFENGAVAWYESASGKVIKGISMPDDHMVGTLAFHPGGTYLACGLYAEGTWNLFLVDIPSGEIVNELLIEKSPLAVCFSPTGERLAVFGSSGKVTIWDATKLMKLNGK